MQSLSRDSKEPQASPRLPAAKISASKSSSSPSMGSADSMVEKAHSEWSLGMPDLAFRARERVEKLVEVLPGDDVEEAGLRCLGLLTVEVEVVGTVRRGDSTERLFVDKAREGFLGALTGDDVVLMKAERASASCSILMGAVGSDDETVLITWSRATEGVMAPRRMSMDFGVSSCK